MPIKAKFDVLLGALREADEGVTGSGLTQPQVEELIDEKLEPETDRISRLETRVDDHFIYLRETSPGNRPCRISISDGRIVVEFATPGIMDGDNGSDPTL